VEVLRPRLRLRYGDEEILGLRSQWGEALEDDASLIWVDPKWSICMVWFEMEI